MKTVIITGSANGVGRAIADTVKFVFDLPHEITIPSIEVRHIDNY